MQYNYKTKSSKGYNTIELGIKYEIGGYSYFTSTTKPRCYYLSALACTVTEHQGFKSKEHSLFDDSETARACQNVLIKEVKRANAKYEKKLFEAVDWEKYGEAIEARDFVYMQSVIDKLKRI